MQASGQRGETSGRTNTLRGDSDHQCGADRRPPQGTGRGFVRERLGALRGAFGLDNLPFFVCSRLSGFESRRLLEPALFLRSRPLRGESPGLLGLAFALGGGARSGLLCLASLLLGGPRGGLLRFASPLFGSPRGGLLCVAPPLLSGLCSGLLCVASLPFRGLCRRERSCLLGPPLFFLGPRGRAACLDPLQQAGRLAHGRVDHSRLAYCFDRVVEARLLYRLPGQIQPPGQPSLALRPLLLGPVAFLLEQVGLTA